MDAMAQNGEETFLAEALISHAVEALLLTHGLEATQRALLTLQSAHPAQAKPCPSERAKVAAASEPALSSWKPPETVGVVSAGSRSRWADLEDDDE